MAMRWRTTKSDKDYGNFLFLSSPAMEHFVVCLMYEGKGGENVEIYVNNECPYTHTFIHKKMEQDLKIQSCANQKLFFPCTLCNVAPEGRKKKLSSHSGAKMCGTMKSLNTKNQWQKIFLLFISSIMN